MRLTRNSAFQPVTLGHPWSVYAQLPQFPDFIAAVGALAHADHGTSQSGYLQRPSLFHTAPGMIWTLQFPLKCTAPYSGLATLRIDALGDWEWTPRGIRSSRIISGRLESRRGLTAFQRAWIAAQQGWDSTRLNHHTQETAYVY